MLARWGMPGPPQFGGAPITNIRNTASRHWQPWLGPEHRCLVPFTSFSEPDQVEAMVIEAQLRIPAIVITQIGPS